MAQQDTPATRRLEDEPNRIYWARRAIQCWHHQVELARMFPRADINAKAGRALLAGASALHRLADEFIERAHGCGGLLFCWTGSTLEDGAA